MKCEPGVAGTGAVLLGCTVAADGYYRRPLRVVTHAHSDHLLGISKSVKESLLIVATEITLRMMNVLGYKVPPEKSLPLAYGSSMEFDGEVVRLVKSRHIAGSSQVLVETPHGSYGYTGDFKMPGTEPLRGLDVLVLDATYGSPRLQRRWGEWDAISALLEIIDRFIDVGPVWIYGYHGKLQEVMAQLRLRGVNHVFMADRTTLKLAEIASEFYRVNLDPVETYKGGIVDYSAIIFIHTSRLRDYRRRPGIHVRLTGWELRAPAVAVDEKLINVSFSDHASFKEILQYVEEASPRAVIVDGYRGREASETARYIEKLLGIRAKVSPPSGLARSS